MKHSAQLHKHKRKTARQIKQLYPMLRNRTGVEGNTEIIEEWINDHWMQWRGGRLLAQGYAPCPDVSGPTAWENIDLKKVTLGSVMMESGKKKVTHTVIATGVKLKSWGDWGGICPYCEKSISAGDHFIQQAYRSIFHYDCYWKAGWKE